MSDPDDIRILPDDQLDVWMRLIDREGRLPRSFDTEDLRSLLLEVRAARKALSALPDQLKTVRNLNDILRRQATHYRDRHGFPYGSCPDCGDKLD